MPKARSSKKTSKTVKPTARKVTATRSTFSGQAASKVSPKLSAQERAQKVTTYVGTHIKEPRVFIPLIIIVIAILLVLFKSAFVVAVVNGQPISRAQYNKMLEAQAGKQVMNALVTQKLIEEYAASKNVNVSQSEIDAQVKTIQTQLAQQGQTLDTALAAQGMSKDDFMTQLKLQTLVKKLLADKIKVSDKEISDYIEKNKDSLPTGESDAQIKSQVAQQLQQQKLSQQAQLLVQQLQQKAKINYFVSY
jgi:foldase protein PrsA